MTANIGKNWCLTWNNYTEENLQWLKDEFICKYLVFGLEIAPETGTKHIQGYFQLEKKIRVTGLKKIFGKIPHFTIARGTAEENKIYCSKEGKPFERGKATVKGERNDLTELKTSIMNGEKTVKDIRQENPMDYHMYGRTLEKIEEDYFGTQKNMRKTEAIWLYGKTGTGKTFSVYEEHGAEDIYTYEDDNGWWDLYDQEKVCLIDEFRGGIQYNELLKLTDVYPKKVKRRNKCPRPFTSEKIYITSSMPPWKVYKNLAKDDSIDQLLRRLNH